jgi:hypothetical protein
MLDNVPNERERKAFFDSEKTRLKSDFHIGSIEQFLDILKDVIQDREVTTVYPDLRGVDIAMYNPKSQPKDPAIVWKIDSQEPATIDKKAHAPFEGGGIRAMKELYPRYRQTSIPDPSRPGYRIDVLGLDRDAFVRFDICSAQGSGTNRISQAFMDFMDDVMQFFGRMGIKRIQWVGELQPSGYSKWQEDLVVRTQFYMVRYEKIFLKRLHELQSVGIRVKQTYASWDSLTELTGERARQQWFEEAGIQRNADDPEEVIF